MVHRRLITALALALTALAGLAAVPVEAANRRISISNYQWSSEDIHVDLGEHVTWYWIGPDTLHSVTGDAPGSFGLDSDAGRNIPDHPVGDSFSLSFASPGTYSFSCKLHSSVRGTVTVSGTPGDPTTEPDPVPQSLVDLRAPRLRKLRLDSATLRGRVGGELRFALGERAKITADYYLRDRGHRRFAGWAKWRGHVGENQIRFGAGGENFDAEPGRYIAVLRATDRSNNESRSRQVRFRITPRAREG